MAPFSRPPGLVEIEPAHLAADVERGLARVEFERGAGHAGAAADLAAGDQRADAPHTLGEPHHPHRAGQRGETHVAHGLVGLLRAALRDADFIVAVYLTTHG